jgi:error-prone DNA polymerase
VYVSAWLKCYEPAAFAAGLLNSQPLGFYAPAQIVYDVKRHGVEVYPVDVTTSEEASTLVPDVHGNAAIRLGLDRVKGLSGNARLRIVQARAVQVFSDVEDLKQRAQLDERDMQALVQADALQNLAGHRREALWTTLGLDRPTPLLQGVRRKERQASLLAPTEEEEVQADYNRTGLTLRSHPLKLLRAELNRRRHQSAAELHNTRPGQLIRVSGIVINRQRPDTDSGVIFATLEDETGLINVTIWRKVAERFRVALTQSSLMTVYGVIERDDATVYVVAGRLVDHSEWLGRLSTRSRDFH